MLQITEILGGGARSQTQVFWLQGLEAGEGVLRSFRSEGMGFSSHEYAVSER